MQLMKSNFKYELKKKETKENNILKSIDFNVGRKSLFCRLCLAFIDRQLIIRDLHSE